MPGFFIDGESVNFIVIVLKDDFTKGVWKCPSFIAFSIAQLFHALKSLTIETKAVRRIVVFDCDDFSIVFDGLWAP